MKAEKLQSLEMVRFLCGMSLKKRRLSEGVQSRLGIQTQFQIVTDVEVRHADCRLRRF